jgi:hypothetical protein
MTSPSRSFPARLVILLVAVLLVTLAAPPVLWAQVGDASVELLVREKKLLRGERVARIDHSDAHGQVPPDSAAFRRDENIHVALRPVGNWTWADEDVPEAASVQVIQGTVALPVTGARLRASPNAPSPVLVLQFPKAGIDLTRPMRFSLANHASAPLQVDERYARDRLGAVQ